jgi:nicotinate dehydrogenase subunit A
MSLQLDINGEQRTVNAPRGSSLLRVLREELDLTGAHYGCGRGICGACYVLVDGEALPACTLSVADVVGKRIVTIEGLVRDGELHPVQEAFVTEDAMQCGACTPGMIISAVALLEREPSPDDAAIRAALAPHLCRCGIYLRAIRAVRRAAR